MIRAYLVPGDRPVLRYTTVVGVHQQVCRWPVVHMWLGYSDGIYELDILKVDNLPFSSPIRAGHPYF